MRGLFDSLLFKDSLETITNTNMAHEDWEESLLLRAADAPLARKIRAALHDFLAAEKDLLIRDVNERTITARFAYYLTQYFLEWDIDCEYNRDDHGVKKINGKIVVPDIVIHKRGLADNLLVIEVKKSNNNEPEQEDIEKLERFRSSHLSYRNALFVKFTVGPLAPGVQRLQWV